MLKWFFCPISALCSKNNPRNIIYMPACPGRFSVGVVIFFACLFIPLFSAGDLGQKSVFMDWH